MNIKLQDYVTLNEKGETVFNDEAFQKALDQERNSASETSRANTEKKLRAEIEKDVRQKIEDEAKLTAEEKLSKDREGFEKERVEFYNEKLKNAFLADKLFTEDEVNAIVPYINGKDYNERLEKANVLIDTRKKHNEEYEKSIVDKYQSQQPRSTGNGGGVAGESDVAKRAQAYANSFKTGKVEIKQ